MEGEGAVCGRGGRGVWRRVWCVEGRSWYVEWEGGGGRGGHGVWRGRVWCVEGEGVVCGAFTCSWLSPCWSDDVFKINVCRNVTGVSALVLHRPAKKKTESPMKYKSVEYIEDSDEELEDEDAADTKKKTTVSSTARSSRRRQGDDSELVALPEKGEDDDDEEEEEEESTGDEGNDSDDMDDD